MSVLPTVNGCTAQRIIGVMLIQPVKFVQNRSTWLFEGRNAVEKIPETFEMIFHLTAATHDITSGRIKNSIAGTAGNVHGFQDVNMLPGHLCISDQEAGSCQGSKAASYDVSMLVIHTLRLLRAGKGFVVAVGIIDPLAVFVIFSTFGIAVVLGSFLYMESFLFIDLFCFFHQHGCAGSGCRKCCKSHESFFI